jgi:glycosyltransferase involved in cell wall biosynthesis
MKKILIIINNLGVGGAERVVVDDINEMIRLGIKVKLLTLKPEYGNSLSLQCKISQDDWVVFPFRGFGDIFSWYKTISFIKSYEPDLVVTHLWFANTIGRIAAKFAGAKKIISFEQNVYDTVKTPKMFFIDKILQSQCLKVIAVSEVVRKSLLLNGIKEKNIDVVYNSVDIKRYGSVIPDKDITLNNNFKFLFVGRLIKQKGVDVLINSFSNFSGATLYIAGRGNEESVLQQLVRKNGLGDKVVFLGLRNDVPSLMKACDCFVYPSRYDGFSLVLLEALASGIPVIASDFEASKEMIKDGESGVIVSVDDIGVLRAAMDDIMKNKDKREKLSSGAVKRAEDFSIEKHVAKLIEYAK